MCVQTANGRYLFECIATVGEGLKIEGVIWEDWNSCP